MTDYRKNFVISMVSYAIQKDIPAAQLCQLAKIDFASLHSKKKMEISSRQLSDLWQHALSLGGDPLFGLHFGEAMQISALGIIGTIIRNSLTIGDALQHCAAYTYLLTDLFDMKVIRGQGKFTIRLIPYKSKIKAFSVMQRQTLELSLAFILHELDGLLLTKMKPDLVVLPYDRKDKPEYERVLRCPNIRRGEEYFMEFRDKLWDEPILTANYELQTMLLGYAEKYKYSIEGSASMVGKITNLLRKNIYLGTPDMKVIAANLNISPRSLQRRLREEGVTYQELTESVRKSIALHYLETNHHQVKEIASILGYNQLSAFTRAFKRWTGQTPMEYRKTEHRKMEYRKMENRKNR